MQQSIEKKGLFTVILALVPDYVAITATTDADDRDLVL